MSRYRVSSPPPAAAPNAAIAIVEVFGDINRVLAALGAPPVEPGRTGLRELPGIDTLMVAHIDPGHAMLFPHAGPAVVRLLAEALDGLGVGREQPASLPARPPSLPSGDDDWHAALSAALQSAASPLAIDLLLAQPARWASAAGTADELPPASSKLLRRLLKPPLIVGLGAPNIGKSSLLNALAGRAVSLVEDRPGTTRDHVGVLIDFAGVVARFADAPGISLPDETSLQPQTPDAAIQAAAQHLALELARSADLLLLCADATADFLRLDPPLAALPALRVGLRADLGPPRSPAEVCVSVQDSGTPGLTNLVALIRDRLVPARVLADNRAWRFWEA